MAERLGEAVRRTFELAALRQEAQKLRTGKDWQSYIEIAERHSRARKKENRDYAANYETRIEAARKILVDEAAKPPRDLTNKVFWRDRFNAAEIERRAERLVRRDHETHLAKIGRSEMKELKDLLGRVERRDRLRGETKREFARTTDRRGGPDRRRGPIQTQD